MNSKLHYIVFFIVISFSVPIYSQGWEPKGPLVQGSSIDVNCFASEGVNIYLGTRCNMGGVYLSNDYGDTWTFAGTNLPNWTIDVEALAIRDNLIFSGMNYEPVFRSSINDLTWSATSGPINATAFFPIGNALFAGTYQNGIHVSTDNGVSWIKYSSFSYSVYAFCIKDNVIYAATSNGVYKLESPSSPWESVNIGIPFGTDIYSIGVSGSNLFAGTENEGIFLSKNNGNSWTQVNNGLEIEKTIFRSLAFKDASIFAAASGMHGNIYESIDNGTTWKEITTGLPSGSDIFALHIKDDYIFAGTDNNGVFRRLLSELVNTSRIDNAIESVSLYPNPAKGIFIVSIKHLMSNQIEINGYNFLGQQILSRKLENKGGDIINEEFKFLDFKKGLYIIQILNDGMLIDTKILSVQ